MMQSTVLFAATLASLLAVGWSASCYSVWKNTEFPHCRQLSPAMVMHWKIADGMITIGLEADQVGGWLGVGPSEAVGGMPGADLWVVHKDAASGAYKMLDTYAEEFAQPVVDAIQDVDLLEVIEGSSSTAVKIQRPMQTCDVAQDNRIYANESHVWLWGFSKGAWPSMHDNAHRGLAVIILDKPTAQVTNAPAPSASAGVEVVPMTMPNISVSTEITQMMCKNFKMPASKHHIVKLEYIINNPEIVHHMSIFGCFEVPDVAVEPEYQPPPGWEEEGVYFCNRTGLPPTGCSAWLINWLPGQSAIYMPEEAGLAVGKGGWEWITLQVHYNNMDQKPGFTDGSGFLLHTTTDLRKHDLGLLLTGNQEIAIPAGLPSYTLPGSGVCPRECLERLDGPVKIVWHSPHMHILGSKFGSPHMRMVDGQLTEISPLSVRQHFGFEYQGTGVVFPEANILQPGDALIVNCTFDSSQRTETTFIGQNSVDEMCYDFISYYPKQVLEVCMPYPNTQLPNSDFAYAYCSTALQRHQVDDTIDSIPPPPSMTMDESEIEAWYLKEAVPVFDMLVKRGWMVKYNLTEHMGYKPVQYTPSVPGVQLKAGQLACKARTGEPKLSLQVAGGSGGKAAGGRRVNGAVAGGVPVGAAAYAVLLLAAAMQLWA